MLIQQGEFTTWMKASTGGGVLFMNRTKTLILLATLTALLLWAGQALAGTPAWQLRCL
jgi:hypothetical protein